MMQLYIFCNRSLGRYVTSQPHVSLLTQIFVQMIEIPAGSTKTLWPVLMVSGNSVLFLFLRKISFIVGDHLY